MTCRLAAKTYHYQDDATGSVACSIQFLRLPNRDAWEYKVKSGDGRQIEGGIHAGDVTDADAADYIEAALKTMET